MPTPKHLFFLFALWALYSCNQAPTPTTGNSAQEAPADKECRLQMLGINNLLGGQYKAVSAQRYCEGRHTKEILLFAQYEAINNDKVCNVFATTDTSIQWQLKLDGKRVDVLFIHHKPEEATILLQQETVYDSIEVVYSIIEALEG